MPRSILLSIVSILTFSAMILLVGPRYTPQTNEEKEHESGTSGALYALDFWNRSRAYPGHELPPSAFFSAYSKAKQKARHLPHVLTAGSVWNPIGPFNLQGRSLAIAVNPQNSNTIYVGTASGGLWRSHSMGLNGDWQRVPLGYPVLGISAIIIDPADSNTMSIGTGEVYGYQSTAGGLVIRTTRGSYGIGILKTNDCGATWTKALDWTRDQERGIDMLAYNPLNSHTIWAATSEGLLRSVDDGSSWTTVNGTILAKDLVINPNDTNKIIASFGNFASLNAGVYKSTNNGATWALCPLPEFSGKTLLAEYRHHPDLVFASVADSTTGAGSLWRSNNFGDTWDLLQNYPPSGSGLFQVQGWYSHYVAVFPADSSIIVHNGVNRSKSVDGGNSFFTVSDGYSDNHGYAIDPNNPNILYVVNDDGVYRSTNFGTTYTDIGYGIQSGQLYNGFSCSTSDSLIALGQSQDHIPGYGYYGSLNWDRSAEDESGWTAIDPTDDQNMYAVVRFGGGFARSMDRGASWSFTTNFDGSSIFNTGTGSWNSPIGISTANPGTIYFGDVHVHKSIDHGASWMTTNSGSMLDGDPILAMAVANTNADTVYAATAPLSTTMHVFRTVDGGTTWDDVTGSLPDRYPIDLSVDPADSKIVYLALGGFFSGHLFKSIDAGAHWTDITGTLPDVPTTAIAIDPLHTNDVYVGNDLGVYVSTDAGGTWSSFNEGLVDAAIVADLVISPANRALRVATHGNGVWERKLINALPAGHTDYQSLAINYPIPGGVDTALAIFSPMRASFFNNSDHSQTDSLAVNFTIYLDANAVYSSTKKIPGLGLGESRLVEFPDPFQPLQVGSYLMQATVLNPDDNGANNQAVGWFDIVAPPPYNVVKKAAAYSSIAGGTSGPSGDDNQSIADLPFPFSYYGTTYNAVQISTNGWVELGTGPIGSQYGLSSSDELGGFFQGTALVCANMRPNKALAPWCTDLLANTDQITYATMGSAPNRVFVIQWHDVPANFDNSTTLLLNFQVRLYETTNDIDFCYGSTVPGYFPPSSAGAAIGFKDEWGGDFRYFDCVRNVTGPIGDLSSSLTPLTNWPGPDSIYHISYKSSTASSPIELSAGWNLISLPFREDDYHPGAIFPGFLPNTAFEYGHAYSPVQTLVNGKGYWIKTSATWSGNISGSILPTTTLNLQQGWNMIGTVDHVVVAPSGGIVTTQAWYFDVTSGSYQSASTLQPGRGYWLKASSEGTIILGATAAPKPPEKIEPASTITITDRSGRRQVLALTDAAIGETELAQYELPPLPPNGVFDARFGSQRTLDRVDDTPYHSILIQSADYPLSISLSVQKNNGWIFSLEAAAGENMTNGHQLQPGKPVVISQEGALRLLTTAGIDMPKAFSLRQNYPNPFNPSTDIRFDVPSRNLVTIVLYDAAGRIVRNIVEGDYDAGSYTVHLDMSGVASGVYFYRLIAGTFTESKKLLFMK